MCFGMFPKFSEVRMSPKFSDVQVKIEKILKFSFSCSKSVKYFLESFQKR